MENEVIKIAAAGPIGIFAQLLTINRGRHILHSRQMQSASDIWHTALVISFFYISNYLSSMPFVSHTVAEFSHQLSIVFNVNSTDVAFVRMWKQWTVKVIFNSLLPSYHDLAFCYWRFYWAYMYFPLIGYFCRS